MVALKFIPKEVLHEIEKFVQENKKVIPVYSKNGGYDLVKAVKEKFGYELSAQQIYKLQKGIHTYRVNLPDFVAEQLKEKYGSVGKGIKHLAGLLAEPDMPDELKRAWRKLLKVRQFTSEEIPELLEDFNDPYRIIRELSKLGYVHREGAYFVVTEHKYNPIVAYLGLG